MTNGLNVPRRLTAGGGRATLGDEYRAQYRKGSPGAYYRAVVLEVITDPASLTAEDRTKLQNQVQNPEFVATMPANTIIAKIVSETHDGLGLAPLVLYPFYQSHMQFPVQAGEHVYVVFEDQAFLGMSLGRWVTRIHENYYVEDLNYTHADRRFDPTLNPELERLSQEHRRQQGNTLSSGQPSNKPGFPNGTGVSGGHTLEQSEREPNPYDSIADSKTAKQGNFEPVPRFIKRPQDFVIQGMNNSLIVLGQDRTGKAVRPEQSSESKDKRQRAGSIDVVAGRGRFLPTPSENSPDSSEEKKTAPLVVENTRGYKEVDKTPALRNRQRNPTEGDPSFEHDAARVLVAMSSVADETFGLKDGTKLSYPDNTLKPTQPAPPSEDVGSSYVVAKADHIRVVARKKTSNPQIKGTVLIVKEGTKDEDLAYLYINDKGELQIEGPKLFLGKAVQDSESRLQPYIRYQEYKATVEHLQSQIDTLTTFIRDTLGTTVAGQLSGAVAIPYSPVAGVVAAATTIRTVAAQTAAQLQQKSGETPNKIVACKSRKIFGE